MCKFDSRSDRSSTSAAGAAANKRVYCPTRDMPGAHESNDRGLAFEKRVQSLLLTLANDHSAFVEVTSQIEIQLLNGQVRKPDFELVYRIDQEHHELIECQSRDRSSLEIADKIKTIKALSARNRFIFVFEDYSKLSDEHRRVLEVDGVTSLLSG